MIRVTTMVVNRDNSNPRGARDRTGWTARVHVCVFRGIPEILERFNVPSEPILRAAKLTLRDLEDPELTASFAEMDELISTCVRETKCTHLGLLLGRYVNLQSFGIMGRLARNAPSVAEALQDLSAFFQLHDSGGSPNIAVDGGKVTFSYAIHVSGIHNANQIYDLSLHAMLNLMRQLCGTGWRPQLILLPRKRPSDLQPYREAFGVPLHFNATQAALEFPEWWLSRPVVDADPLLHSILEDRASVQMDQQEPLFLGDVRRTIRILLASHDCSRGDVARKLGIHERTFGRRLRATGATFQQLLDEARSQLASQLLHDTRAPIARIAASLGYRNPTVFARAFRRWTGSTPRQFRAGLTPAS